MRHRRPLLPFLFVLSLMVLGIAAPRAASEPRPTNTTEDPDGTHRPALDQPRAAPCAAPFPAARHRPEPACLAAHRPGTRQHAAGASPVSAVATGPGTTPAGTTPPAPAAPPASPPSPSPAPTTTATSPNPGPAGPQATANPTTVPANASTPPGAGGDTPPGDGDQSPKWLPMRLAQHERSILRQFGTESADELKQRLERAKALEEQEEQRRQAALSELDREKERANKAEQRAAALEQEREQARADARLTQACLGAGVKNADYARFLIEGARRAGDQRAEAELLAEYLGNDAHKMALGVAVAAPAPTPVNTTPPGGAPPPSNGQAGPPGPKNAMEMSRDEWVQRRKELGLA